MKRRAMLVAVLVGMALVLASGVALAAAAGVRDRTFGGDGVVVTGISPGDDSGNAMVVRANGKIVVAGRAGNEGFGLIGYHPDGDLDRSFGGDGRVTTDFAGPDGTASGGANALVLQPDGKVLAAGYGVDGSFGDFTLARYKQDGSLDESFGGDGKVTTDFGPRRYDEIFSIVLQPDGKIVAAGRSGVASDTEPFFFEFALARYNPDGSPDGSFGEGGRVTTDVGPGDDEAYDLALQPGGELVVAGVSAGSTERFDSGRFAVVRYDADGTLDETFAEGGKGITPFGVDAAASGVILRPDGRIVAAGYARNPSENQKFALAGYLADGSPDPSFGGDGRVTTQVGNDGSYAYDLARQPDGKLVAAGSAYGNFFGPRPGNVGIARYRPDGALDRSFGGDGKVRADVDNSFESAEEVVYTRRKLLVTGSSERCDQDFEECYTRVFVSRYVAD